MSILCASHLKKYYGKDESLVKALDDVSVSVESGQFVAVIGLSLIHISEIIGLYQVKEPMQTYMSGDTFRSENVIFTDLDFPAKAEQDDPLYEKAYFKVADVDDYDAVKDAIRKTDMEWEWYDLIDNNGKLDTMASNFNDLEKISNTLLAVVAGARCV